MNQPPPLAKQWNRRIRLFLSVAGFCIGVASFGVLVWEAIAGGARTVVLVTFAATGYVGFGIVDPVIMRDIGHQVRNAVPFLNNVSPEERDP